MSLFGFWIILLIPNVHASVITADKLYVSTLAAKGNSLTMSSHVYMAAGSSLTLSGAVAVVQSASSITASAFFGNGGSLAEVASLDGDNTFTGGNTFTSSFTIQSGGRFIILSTHPNTGNLTINSNGAVSLYPQLHNSSFTVIPEATTTNTSLGPCIAGSTLTITTSGGRVEIIFIGTLKNDSTFNNNAALSFLQDGLFVGDLGATKGFVARTDNGIYYQPMRLAYLLDAPSIGSHSYCLTMAATNLISPPVTLTLLNSTSSNLFFLKELK